MKTLIIDNYDSFTYNLYQLVEECLQKMKFPSHKTIVKRNDQITKAFIHEEKIDRIIIGPGPGSVENKAYFGVCGDILTSVSKRIPTLGVCLGMQGIGYYYGGKIVHALQPMHGKQSTISHDEKDLFQSIPNEIDAMRYHSLVVDKRSFPDCLEITALSKDTGEIMGLKHKTYPIYGVQFHPESFATEYGATIMMNFLLSQ